MVYHKMNTLKKGYDNMTPELKQAMDLGALGVTLTTVMQIVPPITALLSLVWVCLRIYESVQNIKKNHKDLNT